MTLETLRVAVYDVPPYGYVEADGSMAGVSVDLWRRVAEQMEWPFKLIPVSDMETILGGLRSTVVSTRRSAPSRLRRNGRRASTFRIRPIGRALPSPYERKRVRFSQSCPMGRRLPAEPLDHHHSDNAQF